jgi:hypothetical protein
MTDFDNDFGFTAVDANELEEVRLVKQEGEKNGEKLDELYAAIKPLLLNLKQNPEKDHIFWPNRLKKVESFEKKLKEIYEK